VRSPALKRAVDLVGSGIGLLVAAVPMGLLALLVRRDLGRPVLFRQVRPGRHGRPFTMVKFRTMRDGPGPDDERLTGLGRFLRSASLDELPELWNVFRGDMSLVGPRPLLTSYLDRYNPRQARRHEVRPGLTGLAQVEGRNAVDWAERFELDVRYVDTWTIPGDLAIIVRTVWSVLRRDGIAAEGHATMPEFEGAPE
jgi:sugar transferase EpsL